MRRLNITFSEGDVGLRRRRGFEPADEALFYLQRRAWGITHGGYDKHDVSVEGGPTVTLRLYRDSNPRALLDEALLARGVSLENPTEAVEEGGRGEGEV